MDIKLRTSNPFQTKSSIGSSLLSTKNNILTSSVFSIKDINTNITQDPKEKPFTYKRPLENSFDVSNKKLSVYSSNFSTERVSPLSRSINATFPTSNRLLTGNLSLSLHGPNISTNHHQPMKWSSHSNSLYTTKINTTNLSKTEPTTENQPAAEDPTKNVTKIDFPAYPELNIENEENLPTFDSSFTDLNSLGVKKKEALTVAKENLLKFVSVASGGSLAGDLKSATSDVRRQLVEALRPIVSADPEFVLKLALYTRQDLNLRLISNLLLALAASYPSTSYFISKYYQNVVRLPSDWLMVANLHQTLVDLPEGRKLPPGSLPAVLRKAMKEKFVNFDEYQLAKYNKSVSGPKIEDSEDILSEDEKETIMRSRDFTLKRLIRLLHIGSPADFVMAILGKSQSATQPLKKEPVHVSNQISRPSLSHSVTSKSN